MIHFFIGLYSLKYPEVKEALYFYWICPKTNASIRLKTIYIEIVCTGENEVVSLRTIIYIGFSDSRKFLIFWKFHDFRKLCIFRNFLIFKISRNYEIFGDFRIFGNFWIFGNFRIFGFSEIFEFSEIFVFSEIFEFLEILGFSEIFGFFWNFGFWKKKYFWIFEKKYFRILNFEKFWIPKSKIAIQFWIQNSQIPSI